MARHDLPHPRLGPRRLPWRWGAPIPTSSEFSAAQLGHESFPWPHDAATRIATRIVRTTATQEALRLWLAQLRRAPYSYDWLDNLGRRSPRTPDPCLADLRLGQQFMLIFTLVDFSPLHVTLRMTHPLAWRLFGHTALRYDIGPGLLSYAMWMPARGRAGRARRYLIAWADLIMARKQLLTLARLAEE